MFYVVVDCAGYGGPWKFDWCEVCSMERVCHYFYAFHSSEMDDQLGRPIGNGNEMRVREDRELLHIKISCLFMTLKTYGFRFTRRVGMSGSENQSRNLSKGTFSWRFTIVDALRIQVLLATSRLLPKLEERNSNVSNCSVENFMVIAVLQNLP